MPRNRLLLIALLVLSVVAVASHDGKLWSRSHDGFTRYRDIAIYNAALGPTAPNLTVVGTFLVGCFGANAEQAYMSFEVPDDWVGGEDIDLEIYWTNEAGDALTDGETVIFVINYRVIDFDAGETITNGTMATDTVTYTQSGAGTNLEAHEIGFALDWDHADQPLVVGQRVGIIFNRVATADTYSGDACIEMFEIKYTANDFTQH